MVDIFDLRLESRRIGRNIVLEIGRKIDDSARHMLSFRLSRGYLQPHDAGGVAPGDGCGLIGWKIKLVEQGKSVGRIKTGIIVAAADIVRAHPIDEELAPDELREQ